ncbi:GNAT family N-acetyltransferase [Cellulomonas sp. JZ18]|uniref:GNAT family N-acetyltransferase n=1 Tax=Cellulomonas sp. JZ18 TaxID=2654191 RepID=UPI0012D3B0D1|nr:GNAT family N-acetyltransferase [Cellulomonas sp. JZ18]QGQ17973.1 GNAT family N-acetyltransferase [Cellulomonas sp. JZ18]
MILVTPAAPAHADEVAHVLAEAFEDDPVLAGVVGGPAGPARRTRLLHLFGALVRSGPLRAGTVDVARREGDDRVLGAAVWQAPGAAPGLVGHLGQLPRLLRVDGPAGLLRAASVQRVLDAHRPRRPHWYLQEIGVRASARGLGVGGALVAARLAAVDGQDAPAFLESSTPRNRRLYRRHGFVETAPVRGLPGAAPTGMWRAPRSERATPPG